MQTKINDYEEMMHSMQDYIIELTMAYNELIECNNEGKLCKYTYMREIKTIEDFKRDMKKRYSDNLKTANREINYEDLARAMVTTGGFTIKNDPLTLNRIIIDPSGNEMVMSQKEYEENILCHMERITKGWLIDK